MLIDGDCKEEKPCIRLSWNLPYRVIGSGTHTRVSENRCECSRLKILCSGRHEKRILREIGRCADDAIHDSFTSHPSFSVLTKIIRYLDHHIRTVCYYASTFLAIDFKIRDAWGSCDGRITVVCTEHGSSCFFRSFITRTPYSSPSETCWHRRKYSKTTDIGNGPRRLSVVC